MASLRVKYQWFWYWSRDECTNPASNRCCYISALIWMNMNYDKKIIDMISLIQHFDDDQSWFIKHFDDDQGMVGRACIRFRSLAVGKSFDPSPAAVCRYALPCLSIGMWPAAVACGANGFKENINSKSQPVFRYRYSHSILQQQLSIGIWPAACL